VSLAWFLLFVGGGIFLAYRRIDLRTSTVATGLALLAFTVFGNGGWILLPIMWLLFAAMVIPNLIDLRREKITKPLLAVYRTMLPSMSDTEREALEAGNVWWDGELFSGMPEWDRLMSYPAPALSDEEQAFFDGPCEELCRMLDDWEICHELADMPKEVWDFIIEQRFFAMIIPQQYGGLEFSAYANAMVIAKLASRSPTASSTIGVPNSLGPAELLLHYGTEEQKNHYLPGLAAGTEIPCFALTSSEAGSDAASLIDSGIVCKGKWNGKQTIGIRLNWNKRYITLAPVATVLGLAFKLYDPDHPNDNCISERPYNRHGRICAARQHHRWPGHGRQRLEDAHGIASRRSRDHIAIDWCRWWSSRQLRVRRIHDDPQAVQYINRKI
jgi:acyl-CoA dehydrogenase